MTSPTKDPRTGMIILRRRVPKRYEAVAGQRGGIVKISTGYKDPKAAQRAWPDVLRRWEELVDGWERALNVVAVTPEVAKVIAAKWAAWVAADLGRLTGDGLDANQMNDDIMTRASLGRFLQTPERQSRAAALLAAHTEEAAQIEGITVSSESYPALAEAMKPVIAAAYRQKGLAQMGATGTGPRWNPLQTARERLPRVSNMPAPTPPGASFDDLLSAWKAATSVKPRTVTETAYAMGQLADFVEHDDASRVTKEDIRRWRDAAKAGGITNNTWNNRLSLISQVFALAFSSGKLDQTPTDKALRLRKSKQAHWSPYTDEEACLILETARLEATASRRWAHWVMAFSGMRVSEVLQMTRDDVRQEGGVWFMDINEDAAGKSVKTSQRRNVPIHPVLIAEGWVTYIESITSGPLFPDKALDRHGNRGGRAWNVVGRWVRERVGITRKGTAPDHSWRHRIEDELRAAEVPEDARDAIVGHARKTTGRSYGVRGEALARLHRELSKVPIPSGLVIPVAQSPEKPWKVTP